MAGGVCPGGRQHFPKGQYLPPGHAGMTSSMAWVGALDRKQTVAVVDDDLSRGGGSCISHGSDVEATSPLAAMTSPTPRVNLSVVIVVFVTVNFLEVAIAAYAGSLAYYAIFLGSWAPTAQYVGAALAIASLVTIISIAFGQLQAIQTQPLHKFIWSGLGAVLLAFSFFLSALLLFKLADEYSRGTFLFQFASVAGAVLSLRAIAHKKLHAAIAAGRVQARRAILIGDPANRARISNRLQEMAVDLVYSIGFPVFLDGSRGERYDRDIREMMDTLRAFRPDDIVIVASTKELPLVQRLTSPLSELPASLHVVPIDAASLLAVSTRGELGALVTIQVSHPPLTALSRLAKRVFDVAVATIALVVLAPLLALVAIAIKLDTPGPVFFRQKRHGYNNEVINVLKFRSMSTVEEDGKFRQAVKGDPRITRVGRLLRSTNIDELPQFVNVLTGEMSIVGPRPHPIALNELFAEHISPWRRHAIKPGITGWAQVNGFRGETDTVEKMEKRIEHDLYYIDHWSFMFDVKILLMTVFSKRSYMNAF
jgi:Undecaprenyl-phosphate glucose phosphotransferase